MYNNQDYYYIEEKLVSLLDKYKEEMDWRSVHIKNDTYREIISMGNEIVSLLSIYIENWYACSYLEELLVEYPDFPKEHLGKTKLIVEDWIKFGKEKGYSMKFFSKKQTLEKINKTIRDLPVNSLVVPHNDTFYMRCPVCHTSCQDIIDNKQENKLVRLTWKCWTCKQEYHSFYDFGDNRGNE